MAQAQLKEELIPSGGIADFVMSDAEIAALESEEVRDQFGDSGIARFEPIAKRMASYGRYGDDQVVHAETGELLVPRALIEQSPELKESIFNHLREMGVEDPDRYVVGSSANSINPDTGLPEFFFKSIRRAVSKVAKGVSKAVSKVGKVLKKVAPVVLPIALAMTPLGPIYGAALGSGIGTLVQGGDLKDALKSAVISGAVGGISAGVGSKLGGGTFTEGVKNAAANPLGRLSQTGSNVMSGDFFSSYQPTGTSEGLDQTFAETETGIRGSTEELARATDVTPAQQVAADTSLTPDTSFTPDIPPEFGVQGVGPDQYLATDFSTTPTIKPEVPVDTRTLTQKFLDTDVGDTLYRGALDTAETAGEVYREYLSPSRGMPTASDIAGKTKELMAINPSLGSAEATALATKELTPGMISRYAPIGAIGAAGAAAAGFFDAPPQDDPNLVDRRTGADLLAENPDEYMVGGRMPQYATGPTTVQTQYGLPSGGQVYRNPFMRPQMYAAAGGEVYPRRNGGIMPNEGVPGKDSVRALLMPGEFVMTTDAVKGLGNGSMNQGINNMYSMMRNLEAKGRTV